LFNRLKKIVKKMEITQEKLNILYKLDAEIKEITDIASENLRVAKDRASLNVHKLMRDGKEIEVTEKILWDEVFYLGENSEAGNILKKEHPQVFDLYKKQNEKADELRKFCITELGVDYTRMTIAEHIKIIEGMFKMLLNEKK